MKTGNIVTVLDIGSTKICCCIASVANDGSFSVLGTGYCICLGVKAGVITDMRSAERSIARAVEIAERVANFRVKTVYVSISGKNIHSNIVSAGINIGGRTIKNEDIMQLISMVGNRDEDFEVIHAIPIMFSTDTQTGIKDPTGMIANRLNVSVNLVSAPRGQINNLVACLTRCHLDLSGIVLSCYASGLFMQNDSDMDSSSIVIDFGAGTTEIAFFYDGTFCGSEVIPLGGNNITNDIAFGLNVSKATAERIKALHGAAFVSIDDARNPIIIPVAEDENIIDLQQISKSTLNGIIQPRVEEILGEVKKRIDNSIFKKDFANASIIITGGSSQLTGLRDFTAEILERNVIMKHANSHGIDPKIQVENDFSTTFGIIKFAYLTELDSRSKISSMNNNSEDGIWKKIRNWFKNNW